MLSDGDRARFNGHEYPQVIPVPDEIIPGEPAPWASIEPAKRSGFTLELVEQRLRNAGQHLAHHPLPDEPAEMAAVADATSRPITTRSAVLVALFEEAGDVHLILTRRSFDLRQHRGEIALPGGRSEPGESPIETAIREAHEEVGLDPRAVRAVGWLNPIVTFASGSAIWPVVAVLDGRPSLVANPDEVDRAFTVALGHLLDEDNYAHEQWRRATPRPGADADGYFPIYFYRVPGDLIWGATGRILTELLCLVTQSPWPDAERMWA